MLVGKQQMKALALLSGGLDSAIAVKIVLEQGIEVEALNFATPFTQRSDLTNLSNELGVKLHVITLLEDYLEVVKDPKHGYGSNMNPCIDCRILMLRKAKGYMGGAGASFIVTGEVLGQRPMSQHKDALGMIDKESDLEGLVLRPLSAKFLKPTSVERNGWIDRERLLSIKGRSRKEQIALASSYKISSYSCPSGGCLLTDPVFSRRLRDLLDHCPHPSLNDIELLKIGRHFRLSPSSKLIVGRNEEENKELKGLCQEGDVMFEVLGHNCPVSIARGILCEDDLLVSARLEARYSDAPKDGLVDVAYKKSKGQATILAVRPISDEELEGMRIN